MTALLAQHVVAGGPWLGLSIGEFIIAIIVIAAIVAIAYTALQYFGVAVPPIVVRVFWICFVAVIAIIGIRFLLSL